MDSANLFHSLRLLALSLYASARKVERLPSYIEVQPFELCTLVPMVLTSRPGDYL